MWGELSVEDRDRKAWDALCKWPSLANFDPVRDGLNYADLTRSFLWDKVGRAIRAAIDDEPCAFERTLLSGESAKYGSSVQVSGARCRDQKSQLRQAYLGLKLSVSKRIRGKRVLYCPFPYSRNAQIIERLLDADRDYEVVIPAEYEKAWPGAMPVDVSNCAGLEHSTDFADALHRAIVEGLKKQDVELLDTDLQRLREQIDAAISHADRATSELKKVNPDAVLVPSDNHSPFIEYVLVARRHGIPSIMLQHGLDCERHYLDDAFATHIAVWGENRKTRYERDSRTQPELMRMVGNPAYDARTVPGRVESDGQSWLWLTRPHRPEKCYPPSRSPSEGLTILDGILEALARCPEANLVIKAHSFDDVDAYHDRLERSEHRGRVRFAEAGLIDLIDRADVIITEDSTVGMDGMVGKRVLVHAHLAESSPVMPFVEYGAALPGFSNEEIVASLSHSREMGPGARDAMMEGQQKFLSDFAGPCDGAAGDRFIDFVADVMSDG